MKVTLPETAITTLKNIMADNQDKPSSIRVYFEGSSCCGPAFGLALDTKKDEDLNYEIDGLSFVMSKEDFDKFGDMVIEDVGYGFRVIPESMQGQEGGCSGCSGGCH
ncbi:MAG: Fe-S cluster assembly protein HesB [Clostridioides sp.]|jgi:Fe-S cluster assembly iron-binding protein IscA|nr:Fe-S cluster assembly protein HesB [Clostridioides sp.]